MSSLSITQADNRINNRNEVYKQPGVINNISSALVGSLVSSATIQIGSSLTLPKLVNKMREISDCLPQTELTAVNNAMQRTLDTLGLTEKGVTFLRAPEKEFERITGLLKDECKAAPILKIIPNNNFREGLTTALAAQYKSIVESGKNAYYLFNSKTILLPKDKLSLMFFHEAGHAANQNLSAIGKILQKSKTLRFLIIPIALIALWKTKKAPNQRPENNMDKTTTFIKENAGKLTFAASLPIILEEGLATLKGNKVAKELLSPDLAKKVAKTNAIGLCSYLLTSLLFALGIYFGTKVKDMIAKPVPID